MKHHPRVRILLFIACLLTTLLPADTWARWAEPADAGTAVNFENAFIKVKKDGTYTLELERQIEILKESARTEHGLSRITLQDTSQFELLEAKTINGTRSFPVNKHDVEFKPLASSGPGFDRQKQVTIAFPEVSVGSKLYLKYRRKAPQVEVPGLFYRHFPLGWNEYLQNWKLTIESELQLYHEVHDPAPDGKKLLAVTAKEKSVTFTLTTPFYRSIWEEEGASMPPKSVIWIGVSTAKSWGDLPSATINAYESTMAAELPEKFRAIVNQAKEKGDDIEQINTVTSLLAEQVRYVGDWRLVKGAFHPRSLEKITTTGYGDCKDFTVSTGSMLKRLGYEVHAAWVARGRDWVVSPLSLAAPNMNHAILYAKKNGREFFLDPTNTSSFAQGTYNDIAGHPAIILIPNGGAEVKQIPLQQADGGGVETVMKLQFNGHSSGQNSERSDGTIHSEGVFSLLGHAAVSMTAAELSSTKKALDYTFIRWITNTANLDSWEVGSFSLKSRVVQDIRSTFKFQEQWRPITTSAGPGYLIPIPHFVNTVRVRIGESRVSSLRLEDPITWKREHRFSGREISFAKDLTCEGKSPWVDYRRELKKDGKDAILSDTIKSKMAVIPINDLATPEFAKLQADLIRCMQEAVIVFK